MILEKTIKVIVNPNSRKYYNTLGYSCKNYEEIEINVIDLSKGSNIEITACCEKCNSIKPLKYNKYYKNTKGYTVIYTCNKCSSFKAKKTKLEKYGDENFSNVEKRKITKNVKYGDPNYTNREKCKITD